MGFEPTGYTLEGKIVRRWLANPEFVPLLNNPHELSKKIIKDREKHQENTIIPFIGRIQTEDLFLICIPMIHLKNKCTDTLEYRSVGLSLFIYPRHFNISLLLALLPSYLSDDPRAALTNSRLNRAILEMRIFFGQTASHSASLLQLPKPRLSIF